MKFPYLILGNADTGLAGAEMVTADRDRVAGPTGSG